VIEERIRSSQRKENLEKLSGKRGSLLERDSVLVELFNAVSLLTDNRLSQEYKAAVVRTE
jgi:hypothetical protein